MVNGVSEQVKRRKHTSNVLAGMMGNYEAFPACVSTRKIAPEQQIFREAKVIPELRMTLLIGMRWYS